MTSCTLKGLPVAAVTAAWITGSAFAGSGSGVLEGAAAARAAEELADGVGIDVLSSTDWVGTAPGGTGPAGTGSWPTGGAGTMPGAAGAGLTGLGFAGAGFAVRAGGRAGTEGAGCVTTGPAGVVGAGSGAGVGSEGAGAGSEGAGSTITMGSGAGVPSPSAKAGAAPRLRRSAAAAPRAAVFRVVQ